MIPVVKPMHVSHITEINDVCVPQGLKLLVIPYTINQPADLQLWNSNFCSISLFEIDRYLEDNAKNIMYSLRMAAFIRQCKLKNKIA